MGGSSLMRTDALVGTDCLREGRLPPLIPGKFDLEGIPPFTSDGVLPLALLDQDGAVRRTSPFRCLWSDVASRLLWNAHRRRLALGFAQFSKDLLKTGVDVRWAWLGGSFVTSEEAPRDLDLVVFYRPPQDMVSVEAVKSLANAHPALFVKKACIEAYGCDPTFVLYANRPDRLAAACAREQTFFTLRKDGAPRVFCGFWTSPNPCSRHGGRAVFDSPMAGEACRLHLKAAHGGKHFANE